MQIQPRFVISPRVPTLLSSLARAPQATSTQAPARRPASLSWREAGDSVVEALSRLLLVLPSVPTTGAARGAQVHARRNEWFISQYKNMFNANEDVKKNANCGPACVTMIAKGFGKISPGAQQADAAIEEARRRMGESLDEQAWTSAKGLVKAATSYGMSASNTACRSIGEFKAELAKGRMLIANVVPKYLGESTTGGHFTVVTAIKDGKVFLNDPISSKGPIVVSEQDFMKAVKAQNTYSVTSIGA